uniref:SU10 major capsid protein n=1 Tax=Lentzea pudingi TaxID=1789439 RepID=UPI0035712C87
MGFIVGRFQEPTDNSTVRRTRGILDATSTNVVTHATATPLAEAMVLDLCRKMWENDGIQVSGTATLMCGAWQKRMLTPSSSRRRTTRSPRATSAASLSPPSTPISAA